jgi:hypothetical protein
VRLPIEADTTQQPEKDVLTPVVADGIEPLLRAQPLSKIAVGNQDAFLIG